MRISKIIERLRNLDLDYEKKLEVFINTYSEMVDLIESKVSNQQMIADARYTAEKLSDWIEYYGYEVFYSTISNLRDNISDKMNGFIDYYTFLLESSVEDEYNLIDLLFAIPGQFAKEFNEKKESLVIEDWDNCVEAQRTNEPRYVYYTTGTFEKVPCFV